MKSPFFSSSSVSNVDLGRTDQPPAALGGVLADDALQLGDQRRLGLLEALGVGRREAEHEVVRGPDLVDAHGAPGVHLLDQRAWRARPAARRCGTSWRTGPRRGHPSRRSKSRRFGTGHARAAGPRVPARSTPGVVAPLWRSSVSTRVASSSGGDPRAGSRTRSARRAGACASATRGSPSTSAGRRPGSGPRAGTGAWPAGETVKIAARACRHGPDARPRWRARSHRPPPDDASECVEVELRVPSWLAIPAVPRSP